jgi:hypothetical protein
MTFLSHLFTIFRSISSSVYATFYFYTVYEFLLNIDGIAFLHIDKRNKFQVTAAPSRLIQHGVSIL